MTKRIVTMILIVCMILTAMFTFAGCAKVGECDGCGQKETLTKYETSYNGTLWLCDDCTGFAKFLGY
jgi:uncharacterized protein YceK